MKVLVISTTVVPLGTSHYGGIEKMCLDLIEELIIQGHKVTVAAPQNSNLPSEAKYIPTVKVPEEQDRDTIATNAMAKYITDTAGLKDVEYWDIIHDFSHHHILGLREIRVPAVFMLWDPVAFKYRKSRYNVLGMSEWQAGRFREKYGQECKVIGPWVDMKVFRPILNPRRERFLFLGKLSPEKGPDLAIDYCKEVGAELDVVGGLIPSEQNSSYVDYLRQRTDGEKIKLYYDVTEEEKLQFLQNAKAVIYPVRQEEAGWLVGAEAWACGIPTIVANKGAMPTIVPNPDFIANNKVDFLEKMKDTDRLQDVGRLYDFAHERFDRRNAVKRCVELYEQVVKGLIW